MIDLLIVSSIIIYLLIGLDLVYFNYSSYQKVFGQKPSIPVIIVSILFWLPLNLMTLTSIVITWILKSKSNL